MGATTSNKTNQDRERTFEKAEKESLFKRDVSLQVSWKAGGWRGRALTDRRRQSDRKIEMN